MFNVSCNQAEPYADAIATFVKREFPILVKTGDVAMLDLLTDAIVASGQVRYGPKPSPESLVAIREVITYWTDKGQPIPFLVAWGSEKPDGSGIDIAELFAMKTLTCLNNRVRQYYPAGVVFNIRVEDASAPHLFVDNQEKARKDAALYTDGFVKLARVIGVSGFVNVRPESTMLSPSSYTTEQIFNAKADEILPAMAMHVNNPLDPHTREHLATYGWRVPLGPETLNWYLDRYVKLYPDKSMDERKAILARYFAGALARYALKMTGADEAWQGKFLELAFTAPTPGIGAQRSLRRIYYRTMPSSITSNHMPPWRAKGYVRVGDEITASLTSFHNTELEFNQHELVLSYGDISQTIQADYVLA